MKTKCKYSLVYEMFLLFSNQYELLNNLQKFDNIATVTYRFGEKL